MREIELNLYKRGLKTLVGIDEAGRGPLAGPVVAAAVYIPLDVNIPDVNDSKVLQPKKRDELYEVILESGAVGVGLASPEEIDCINIFQATFLAMRRAVDKLPIKTGGVLVDGRFTIPGIDGFQQAIVKGDASCFLIACASIIAKVTRDRIMETYDCQYPQYGFAANKGYPTKAHRQAIVKYGPTPIHRLSFGGVKEGKIS